MATLGENLRKIRKAKKMTQAVLAQKSGVKQSVISDLETGNARNTGFVVELATALGVTAEDLKKGVDTADLITSNVAAIKPNMAPVLSWVQAGVFINVQAVDMSQVEEWLPLPDDLVGLILQDNSLLIMGSAIDDNKVLLPLFSPPVTPWEFVEPEVS